MFPAKPLVAAFATIAMTASVAAAQNAAGEGPNKCLAAKNKCVAKAVQGLLNCRAKCQKKPSRCGQAQADCEAKVWSGFTGVAGSTGCFAKAEAGQTATALDSVCLRTADADLLAASAAAAVDEFIGLLEGPRCPSGDYAGSTLGATNQVGNAAGDALFPFSLLEPLTVVFDSCGSDFDTYLRVFDANLGTQLCGCDDCGDCGSQTILTCELPAGDYVAVVEGFDSAEGSYVLRVSCSGG